MEEIKAIEKIIDQYVESINTCDAGIVERIWSHEDFVSFVAPVGQFTTWKSIRDDFVLGVFDKLFQKRDLQKEDLKIHLDGNMAWAEFTWKFDAIKKDGGEHHTRGFETQILQKDPDGAWKLVHIHYSAL